MWSQGLLSHIWRKNSKEPISTFRYKNYLVYKRQFVGCCRNPISGSFPNKIRKKLQCVLATSLYLKSHPPHPSNSRVIFRLMQCAPELAQFNQSNRNSVTVPITQCAPITMCGRFKGRSLFNLFRRCRTEIWPCNIFS